MPRPHKARRIQQLPPACLYKPQGIPARQLREIVLSVDGFEALRLADAEGLDHEGAAGEMGVSRPTFSRILAEARAVVATALTQGCALRIEGGPCRLDDAPAAETSPPCGGGHGHGRRGGRKE